jgi:hypothetical protein
MGMVRWAGTDDVKEVGCDFDDNWRNEQSEK